MTRRREKRTNRDRLEVFSGLFRATENALGQTRQWIKVQRLLERVVDGYIARAKA